jgi:hypothetical protein
MKPLEAADRLKEVAAILAAGAPLPPTLRAWLLLGIHRRLSDPAASLEQTLGLRSRSGGRLRALSPLPERDAAVRALMEESPGAIAEKARALSDRVKAHRQHPDPALVEMEARHGRLPASAPQLDRILRGNTAASLYRKE